MLFKAFFNNTGTPKGFLGKLMLKAMNSGHASVADWGLSYISALSAKDIQSVADIGCGGGRNVARLLQLFPNATVNGVDRSELACQTTLRLNKDAVSAGSCHVTQGSADRLPFKDESLDLITAFETVYFWQGPTTSFQEVRRSLKAGGTFLIVNESDGTDKADQKWTHVIDDLHIYTQEDLISSLTDAGFSSVCAHADLKRHWLCLVAKK